MQLVPHDSFCLAEKFAKQYFLLNSFMKLGTDHPAPHNHALLSHSLDVTESQLSLCLAYLLTAFFGPEVWTVKVLDFSPVFIHEDKTGIGFICIHMDVEFNCESP